MSPLRPPPAQRLRQDQRGRASLAVDKHYAVQADNAGEKYLHGRCCVCVRCVCATFFIFIISTPMLLNSVLSLTDLTNLALMSTNLPAYALIIRLSYTVISWCEVQSNCHLCL